MKLAQFEEERELTTSSPEDNFNLIILLFCTVKTTGKKAVLAVGIINTQKLSISVVKHFPM